MKLNKIIARDTTKQHFLKIGDINKKKLGQKVDASKNIKVKSQTKELKK